ncbi:MAG: hypothetical protein ACRDRL_24990 [Sciscionella sp.]
MAHNISELTEKVATILGPEWSAKWDEHPNQRAFLIGPQGANIRLLADRYTTRQADRDKIRITGYTPHALQPYGRCTGQIRVADSATPSRVAAEISRRLLPDYLGQVTNALAIKQEHEAQQARNSALAADLTCSLGPQTQDGPAIGNVHLEAQSHASVMVDGDVVTFTVTVPAHLARDLAGLIGQPQSHAESQRD